MLRRQFLTKLQQFQSPGPAQLFVALWDYFQDCNTRQAENTITERGDDLRDLQPLEIQELRDEVREIHARLTQAKANREEFDWIALRWLMRQDLELLASPPRVYDEKLWTGVRGNTYWLKPRNTWLVDCFEFPSSDPAATNPGATKQAPAFALQVPCRYHMAVPQEPVSGLTIQPKPSHRWCPASLHFQLQADREFNRFSVLLWPFKQTITHPGVDLSPPTRRLTLASLCTVDREEEIMQEVLEAVQEARALKATVLLFPELTLTPELVDALSQELAAQTTPWPALTLLGACHRAQPGRNNFLNEAILLGPNGAELHRHQKFTKFTHDVDGCWITERIDMGETLTVLESPLGNLVPIICLDLFQDATRGALLACHGNLFLVPSLSPSTRPHLDAARLYHRQRLVSSFVCNRWLETNSDDQRRAQTSFVLTGAEQQQLLPHWPAKKATSGPRRIEPPAVKGNTGYLWFQTGAEEE